MLKKSATVGTEQFKISGMQLSPETTELAQSVKLCLTKESSLKVRPPFTKLPAFTVNAIVLSYIGYEDEVFALLLLLNRNCGLY